MCVGKMFWGGLVEYRLVGGLDLPLASIFISYLICLHGMYCSNMMAWSNYLIMLLSVCDIIVRK